MKGSARTFKNMDAERARGALPQEPSRAGRHPATENKLPCPSLFTPAKAPRCDAPAPSLEWPRPSPQKKGAASFSPNGRSLVTGRVENGKSGPSSSIGLPGPATPYSGGKDGIRSPGTIPGPSGAFQAPGRPTPDLADPAGHSVLLTNAVQQDFSALAFAKVSSMRGRAASEALPPRIDETMTAPRYRVTITGYPGGAEFSQAIRNQLEGLIGQKLGAQTHLCVDSVVTREGARCLPKSLAPPEYESNAMGSEDAYAHSLATCAAFAFVLAERRGEARDLLPARRKRPTSRWRRVPKSWAKVWWHLGACSWSGNLPS
jgi:hypothetical protein